MEMDYGKNELKWTINWLRFSQQQPQQQQQICPNFYSMTFGLTFYQHENDDDDDYNSHVDNSHVY